MNWINIKEKKPNPNDIIKVLSKNGQEFIAQYNPNINDSIGKIFDCNIQWLILESMNSVEPVQITHWRPK